MRKFYNELTRKVKQAVRNLYPACDLSSLSESAFSLAPPRNREFGDLSLSLPLKLSSILKAPPYSIAETLRTKLEKTFSVSGSGVERIEVVKPGFINLFLTPEKVHELFNRLLAEGSSFFKEDLAKGKRILLEFVSANPTGPLSIASGRQAVVGDVLAALFSFFGAEVLKEYYINDEGSQIDLFVESVRQRMEELRDREFVIPEGGYSGEYVKDIAQAVLEDKKFEDRGQALRDKVLKAVLDMIKNDLLGIGLKYDSWVSQKNLNDTGKIKEAVDFLKDQGLTYEQDSALWFKSSLSGDEKDRVLVRKDGSFTYFSADIAYHKNKLDRGYKTLLNLWGPDHHGYIPRIKAALKSISGGKEENSDFNVLIIQLVSVKSGKMSKRKGTAVLLKDLVSEAGKDAVRFYYLLRKNSSHLDFDLEKAVSKSFDNPLYYVQYAYARICGIKEKINRRIDVSKLNLLVEKEELSLIKSLFAFRGSLESALIQSEPFFIVDYLKNLASSFHKFYETCRVLDKDNPDLTSARLSLIEGVRITLKLGLDLLNINAPEKM